MAEDYQEGQHWRRPLFWARVRSSCRSEIFSEAGDPMNNSMNLETLLSAPDRTTEQQLALFALLNLGIIESLAKGLVSAADAQRAFFNAENCQFVRQQLREKIADRVMSHGVQLPDLFDVLAPEEAQLELQRELATMRSFCLKLLENKRLVA
jgi:hypothetical protein